LITDPSIVQALWLIFVGVAAVALSFIVATGYVLIEEALKEDHVQPTGATEEIR
jgi:hypothetical protein